MLLTVLVISGAVSSYLLLQIVGIVRQVIEVEDPLERAALEMEINSAEATQALFNFITDPRQRHIDRFMDSDADFRRYAEQFSGLVANSNDEALADEVVALQREFNRLGGEIIDIVAQRKSDLTVFRNKTREIDNLIDESLQRGLDPEDSNYIEKLNAALDIEINVDEAFGAVESYLNEPDPQLLDVIADATADFNRFMAIYRNVEINSNEQSLLDHIVSDFNDTLLIGKNLITTTDQLVDALAKFRGGMEDFDRVIDDEVQKTVLERKVAAHTSTQETSWLALIIIVVMAAFVLVIAGISTWVTTKKIVRSFWSLVTGIDQFAHGNFEHRIALNSDDELGRLGDAFNQMVEQRRRAVTALDEKNRVLAELSSKLSKYLSPQVYESIFRGEQEVAISTARKKLTVLFSDIKDFTATTDKLEPEELTYLLNDYLTEMSEIALEYGATIDKYVGDAMLLFFGDPSTKGVKEDALACVHMAIDMQRRMIDLRARWRDLGHEFPLHMRIGINTGYCNVGNFGSDERMDYTIIGGEVNLAARLESVAPVDGIMLAYETYAFVKNEIETEEQAPLRVKGYDRDIRTYSVKGIYDDRETGPAYLHAENDSMSLHLDLRKLDQQGRIKAAEELERYAARLRHSGDESD